MDYVRYSLRACVSCTVLLMVLGFVGCKKKNPVEADETPPTVQITSPGSGAFVSGTVTIQVNVTDDTGVAKVEFYVDGIMKESATTSPWQFSWNTDSYSDGAHVLMAKAYDKANNVGSSSAVTVVLQTPFTLNIRNTVLTDMTISVVGFGSRLVTPAATSTFLFSANPGTVGYSAQTSGKTSSGTAIGLTMSWSSTFNTTGLKTRSIDLVVGSDYFFMYMRNTGSRNLSPVYVNYALISQTMDNILIPNDGQTYQIGYYRAYSNTQVRAYWVGASTSYTYWNQGTHFILPFTDNQSATLWNNLIGKYGEANEPGPPRQLGSPAQLPLPAVQRPDLERIRGTVSRDYAQEKQ
ncbi:MAG: Ig-like domain-containing protein [Ignavibacteriales bacterium]|nr:Ig-like domain-containing protein [Ignavibacteriales bacterium]